MVMENIAYIDGQNLFMGTTKRDPEWRVDLNRFRVYLKEKYRVDKAYYFLGYVQEGSKIEELYDTIQSAGFILVFRQHNSAMIGEKKGNVDSDIIFSIMKRMYLKDSFQRIVLVSGDGDYKMLIDFLVEEDKLEKILFPKQRYASSLYKTIDSKYIADLSNSDVRRKIAKKKAP
jgi:uncharacterized LabA/DUF88 family protein